MVREVLVDWLHDRLYLLVSQWVLGEEQQYATSTSRTRAPKVGSRVWSGQPFYLDQCDLLGANCHHLDTVFNRKPEYLQVVSSQLFSHLHFLQSTFFINLFNFVAYEF